MTPIPQSKLSSYGQKNVASYWCCYWSETRNSCRFDAVVLICFAVRLKITWRREHKARWTDGDWNWGISCKWASKWGSDLVNGCSLASECTEEGCKPTRTEPHSAGSPNLTATIQSKMTLIVSIANQDCDYSTQIGSFFEIALESILLVDRFLNNIHQSVQFRCFRSQFGLIESKVNSRSIW